MEVANKNEGASMEQIMEVENKLGVKIPKVYKDFLMTSNGAEFDDGILYDIETIEEIYYLHEFDQYAPEYISIGNNNGDYELVMEAKEDGRQCGLLEQGSIGSLEPEYWQDFDIWVSNGCSFEFGEEEACEKTDFQGSWSQQVKVVLVKIPEEKTKTLMKIRKALQLQTPVKELLSISENVPYILTDYFSYAQAKRIIEEEELGQWVEIQTL